MNESEYQAYTKEFVRKDYALFKASTSKDEYVNQAFVLHLNYFGLGGNDPLYLKGIYMSMWDHYSKECV